MSLNKFKIFILSLLFFNSCLNLFSQSEIKINSGLSDLSGISYEYSFKNNVSAELGGSYRLKSLGEWHGLQNQESFIFITGTLKKYKINKKGKTIFYRGGYVRYFQNHTYVVDATKLPLPASIQSLHDSN